MKLDTVISDVIHAVGYDDDTGVLEVIFNNGQIYQYRNVPRDAYEGLMRAESKGRYFQDNIRGEFEFWQWEPALAQFIRAEEKGQQGPDKKTDLKGMTE